ARRKGERGGEPGGFDPVEVDEAGDAVLGGTLDHEIGGGLARVDELRPDPRVAGLECAVGEARPVATDRGIKAIAAPRIDGVVDPVDPFDIGPEARLAGEVEG